MEKKIGFIGCGNMGKAILGGLIASGQVLPGQIWVYTPSPDKVAALHDQFGINAAESAPIAGPTRRWSPCLGPVQAGLHDASPPSATSLAVCLFHLRLHIGLVDLLSRMV